MNGHSYIGDHSYVGGRSYIGGKAHTGCGSELSKYDPATGELAARFPACDGTDVAAAVSAARHGWSSWSKVSGSERGRVLRAAAARLRSEASALARLESTDTGRAIAETSSYDVTSAAEVLEYFGGLAATVRGEHVDLGGSFFYTRRESLGVCAGIGAWNYPLQIAAWKAAPALACGNAMIFKPSELTPHSAFRLAEILHEAGLPEGAFNVVQGDGSTGAALCEHDAIAKVSLTGSVATGRKVTAAAALKNVTMELGGKSPLIVFDDADVELAARVALSANFYSTGQVCTNATRVFVHRSLHDRFLDIAAKRMTALRVGPPLDPQTEIGPLISAAQKARVLDYIASGESEGATIHRGPALTLDEPYAGGYWVPPVIFSRCSDEMRIVREEIFGPVMSLLSFESEDEVIARANATPFGLAAGVFTRELTRAHRVAAALEAGMCWVNNYNLTPVEMPFGGWKQSGIGTENGMETLNHYTRLKSVYVEMGDAEPAY